MDHRVYKHSGIKLCTFFIVERWTRWNQICVNLNFKYFLCLFIPQKQACFFNSLVAFSKIVLERFFAFSLIEIAFCCFLLDFSNIDPLWKIRIVLRPTKHIIIKYFFMFFFGKHRVKGVRLFYSSFIIIGKFFFIRFIGYWSDDGISIRDYDFLGMFRVSVGWGIGVGEFKEAAVGSDLWRGRVLAEVVFDDI